MAETKTCRACRKEFSIRFPSERTRKFCSTACFIPVLHRANVKPRKRLTCEGCSKAFETEVYLQDERRFCSVRCFNQADGAAGGRRGKNNGHWKGGVSESSEGYLMITHGKHARKFKYQHRQVMEESLGRPLESHEIVHHVNGDKKDNRIENLEIMTHSEHIQHHRDELRMAQATNLQPRPKRRKT